MFIENTLRKSIRMNVRITTYFKSDLFLSTGVHKAVDKARNGTTQEYVEKVSGVISTIISIDNQEKITEACKSYFRGGVCNTLIQFFNDHPTCWPDLQRKIHKHVQRNTAGIYSINREDQVQISIIFLVRERRADTGQAIKTAIDNIIANQEFLAFCSKQPSILDSSGYSVAQVPKERQPTIYAQLIRQGLIQNIIGCTEENVQQYYQSVFRKILYWIPLVYGELPNIYRELNGCDTPEKLGKKLSDIIQDQEYSHYGRRREDAVRVIQSFFSWGNLEEMELMIEQAETAVKSENMMPLLTKWLGLIPTGQVIESEEGGSTIFSCTFKRANQHFTVVWRSKSLLSMLHKLSENEDYTNADSVRDPIGITIIQEGNDSMPSPELIKTVKHLKQKMPHFGFITTNRSFLGKDEFQTLFQSGQGQKLPLDSKDISNPTTNPNLYNLSISGFLRYSELETTLGTEVQVLTRDAYEWKKQEDGYYKGKGITELRMRSPKFDTLRGIYRAFNNRISADVLNKIRVHLEFPKEHAFRINELIIQYINDGWLIPYIINGALVFTNKEKRYPMIRGLSTESFYKVEKSRRKKESTTDQPPRVTLNDVISYIKDFSEL